MGSERQFEDRQRVRRPRSRPEKAAQKENRPGKQAPSPVDLQGRLDAGALRRMQQTVGNGAVRRLLAQRQAAGKASVDEESAAAIEKARGGGTPVDGRMAERAGRVMGRSFADVRVHTGAEADRLSRNLGARAFTTGKDIFFREGTYAPGSREGRQLLAHELTHVVQQGGQAPPPGSQLAVNDPHDAYEAEADAVAATVVNQGETTGALQAEEEQVQRQVEEEEEMLQMQEEEEEEMLQLQEEEEELQLHGDEEALPG